MRIIFLLILLLLSLMTCEYAPTEKNYNSVPEPDVYSSGIDIFALDENVVNMFRGKVSISYSPRLNDRIFVSVNVYIDTILAASTTTDSRSINIYSNNFSDGDHILVLELITTTESGSLADKLGAEVFALRKEYKIFIYNAEVNPPSITNHEIASGYLKFQWDKYTQPGFQKYVLRNHNSQQIVNEVYNVNITECNDLSFIGGKRTYELETVVAGQPFKSNTYTVDIPLNRNISYSVIDSTKILIEWAETPFYQALDHYEVHRGPGDNIDKFFTIENKFLDTDPIFGGESVYNIEIHPKIGVRRLSCQTTVPSLGTRFSYYPGSRGNFEYISSRNAYLSIVNTHFYLIDASSNTLLASNDIKSWCTTSPVISAISSDGKLIYYMTDYQNGGLFIKVSPDDFTEEEEYNISELTNNKVHYLYGLCVSNNNILFTASSFETYGYLCAFDLNTKKYISRIAVEERKVEHLECSDDGKFIIYDRKLFSFKDDTFIEIKDVFMGSKFLKNQNVIVEYDYNNVIQYFDCDKNTVVKEYTIPIPVYPIGIHVDAVKGFIGIECYMGRYFILDPELNQTLKVIRIHTLYPTIKGYRFLNDRLFIGGLYKQIFN